MVVAVMDVGNVRVLVHELSVGVDVLVATVDRGFREGLRCLMAMAGQMPSRVSRAGFSILSRNCRA